MPNEEPLSRLANGYDNCEPPSSQGTPATKVYIQSVTVKQVA